MALLMVGALAVATGGQITAEAKTPDRAGTPALVWPDFVKKVPQRGSPVPMEMVQVPGGTFIMGSNEGQEDERPTGPVTVATFSLGKYEVSNAQYREFVRATGYKGTGKYAGGWEDFAGKWGENAPVVRVSWEDAMSYCYWAGYRLPTEAEWEYAARGPQGRVYPWGNQWEPKRAACGGNSGGRAHPVGSHPLDSSWCGCMDMAGNVWEWCSTQHARYPYNANDGRELLTGSAPRVVRGGSWDNVKLLCSGSDRSSFVTTVRYYGLGFRCAKIAP